MIDVAVLNRVINYVIDSLEKSRFIRCEHQRSESGHNMERMTLHVGNKFVVVSICSYCSKKEVDEIPIDLSSMQAVYQVPGMGSGFKQ